MTKPIAEYKGDQLATGLFPSQNDREGAIWKDGRNVVFEEQAAKAGLGQYGLFYTETAQPLSGLRSTLQNYIETVYFGTATKLKKWTNGGGVVDLTRSSGDYTGTISDLWAFARWGTWMVASNGVDKIQVDKFDGNGFADLTSPFDYAKNIYTTDTQLIAFNTSNGGEYIEWTDVDDIEDWTTTSINQAGNLPQRNLDSEILGVKKLSNVIGVYTKNELINLSYIGTPLVFSAREGLDSIGVVGKFAVTGRGRRHYGFGRRGIWVTDGVSYDYIDSPAMHQLVYGDSDYAFDQTQGDLVIAWHDQLQRSISFCYPTIGFTYNNITISFNYVDNNWTVADYGRTVVDDSGIFPFALSADRQGNIFQQASTATPPQAGEQGFVDLTNALGTIETGFGEIGYGRMGYGGTTYDAG